MGNDARGFFVRLDELHMCAEFQKSRSNAARGLNFCNFLGGAIEPFWYARVPFP